MKNNKSINKQDDTQKVLNQHGVKDIIPEGEEWYDTGAKRARTRPSENDLNPTDIASTDPYDNLDNEEPDLAMPHSSSPDEGRVVTQVQSDRPTSSNDGGPVPQKDLLDEDPDQGHATGEFGDTRVDDQTG